MGCAASCESPPTSFTTMPAQCSPRRSSSFSISQPYRSIIRVSTSQLKSRTRADRPGPATDLCAPSITSRIRQSSRSTPRASSPGGDISFGTGSSTVYTVSNSSPLMTMELGLGLCNVKSLGVSWQGYCHWLVGRECWPGLPDLMRISSSMWKGSIVQDSMDAQNSRYGLVARFSSLTHSYADRAS